MSRRLILLAVLVTAALGCGKKTTDDDYSGGSGGITVTDPNATYTLQLREPQAGDKFQVTMSDSATFTLSFEPRGSAEGKVTKEGARYVYTEEVIEVKPDERPTKARRVYKAAERTEDGKKVTEVFQNKTVLIDKPFGMYQFRIEGGGPITGPSAKHLLRTYKDGPSSGNSNRELLPERPVKVGESWNFDKKAMPSLFGDNRDLKIDPDKTTATGRLRRVYRKDGRLFGVILIGVSFAVKDASFTPGAKLKPGAKLTADLTLDACIDGSSSDSEAKGRVTLDFTFTLQSTPGGPSEMRMMVEGNREESEKQIAGASPPPGEKAGSTARGTSPTARSSTPTARN